MEYIYQQPQTVKFHEVDFAHRLKPTALLHYFQEAAWRNADLLKFGYRDLRENNAFWVLSRILVEIEALPAWNRQVVVETWPKGSDKLFALRDFRLLTG